MTAFAMADMEYIVLETGLGGRLDATNAIDDPVLTVITAVGMDHNRDTGRYDRKNCSRKGRDHQKTGSACVRWE